MQDRREICANYTLSVSKHLNYHPNESSSGAEYPTETGL